MHRIPVYLNRIIYKIRIMLFLVLNESSILRTIVFTQKTKCYGGLNVIFC